MSIPYRLVTQSITPVSGQLKTKFIVFEHGTTKARRRKQHSWDEWTMSSCVWSSKLQLITKYSQESRDNLDFLSVPAKQNCILLEIVHSWVAWRQLAKPAVWTIIYKTRTVFPTTNITEPNLASWYSIIITVQCNMHQSTYLSIKTHLYSAIKSHPNQGALA